MKENKEFQASETDYIEAIDAASNAIVVLGKHNPQLAQLKAVAHRLVWDWGQSVFQPRS